MPYPSIYKVRNTILEIESKSKIALNNLDDGVDINAVSNSYMESILHLIGDIRLALKREHQPS